MNGEQSVIEVLKKAGAFSGDHGITTENIAHDPSMPGFGSIDLTMKIIDNLYDQGIVDAIDGPDGKELWFLTGRKAVAKHRLTAIIKTKHVKSKVKYTAKGCASTVIPKMVIDRLGRPANLEYSIRQDLVSWSVTITLVPKQGVTTSL